MSAHADATHALVKLAIADRIATVTLARAAMRNALVPELLLELCVALETIARRDDLHCVVLRAEGEVFSIGGDMRRFEREMRGAGVQAYSAELVGLLNQAVLALVRLPQPVVAAVQGVVTGGSIGLVLAADVVIASTEVRFKAHYASAGFSPDGGWTALLPERVGARRAAAGLLLNRTIDAFQARDWGLVTDVVASPDLGAAVDSAARRIAGAPRSTVRSAKRLLWGDSGALERALEAERQLFVETIDSAEARAGVADFLRRFGDYPADEAGA